MITSDNIFSRSFTIINPLLFWAMAAIIAALAVWSLVSLFLRLRTSPTKGRKLGLAERFSRRLARIVITGDRKWKPRYITMQLQNYGRRPVDLQAPSLVFMRWNSVRRFRINSFGGVDDFPMWLEPGYEATYRIDLDQFYDRIPILRRATRLSAEIREMSGKKFVSQTIRLKLI